MSFKFATNFLFITSFVKKRNRNIFNYQFVDSSVKNVNSIVV